MTLSNASNHSFSDCLYFFSSKFFNEVFFSIQNFKLKSFTKYITWYVLCKQAKKRIKKVQVYRKESMHRPQTKHLQNLHT